jgi:hypothetical protein
MDLLQHPTVADMVRLIERPRADQAQGVEAQQQRQARALRQRAGFVQRRAGTERTPS